MRNHYLNLRRSLKAYALPDTSSESVAMLLEGKYELIERKSDYPTADTDYAHIKTKESQEVWICYRWKDHIYADVEEVSLDLTDFTLDQNAIDESHLTDLLPSFSEFTYHLRTATYPFNLEGVNVPQAPPASNNCCTFVEAITVKAWQNSYSDFRWNNKKHGQMMIFSVEDYFSPVTCLVESEMAIAINDQDAIPHKWSVIQGWRKEWSGGHTFIILDHHKETDRILTLESNKAFGLNGVGYRMLGNFRDINKPSSDWWTESKLPTWEKIKNTYKFRRQCVLKVKNVNWI
ncbi:hypothetical protein [Ekhidna sp.]|uniref:hypothetical protein n=1 Tax=Ekhidna sp. TaxID=2608089 RepID=UPI00329A6000